MKSWAWRRIRPLTTIAVVLLLFANGCGLAPASQYSPSVQADSIPTDTNLRGAHLTVTSKNFTEQLILGKIAVLVLKAAGARVTDKTNVQGSINARRSLERGDADLMWEYTGTGWITYLGKTTPVHGAQAQFDAVNSLDQKRNGITWIDPAPYNNTWAIAMKEGEAKKYGLKNISDINKLPVSKRQFCVTSEFFSRSDGLQNMLQAYGIPYGKGDGVPAGNVRQMSDGVVFNDLSHGQCLFGAINSTDGRILGDRLTLLKDDQTFFPNYNPALMVKTAVVKAHPEIVPLFEQVSKQLTTATIRRLNRDVDMKGEEPAYVARDWLRSEGFVK